MSLLSKLKSKRAFTLVELIVVLTILAVLAALLIPSLTEYIRKANETKVITQARSVLVAAQATVAEAYGRGQLTLDEEGMSFPHPSESVSYNMAKQIYTLSDTDKEQCEWRFSLLPSTDGSTPTPQIDVFEFCNKQYRVTYRLSSAIDEPAGWGTVQIANKLPDNNPEGNPPFLECSDYNPDTYPSQ